MPVKDFMKMYSGLFVIFGWLFINVVKCCNEDLVLEALQACKTQREDLSSISGSSFSTTDANYTQLCVAFKSYVKCMDPRIRDCNGTATSAFKIIKDTYSADPYSCMLDSENTKKEKKPVKVNTDIPTKSPKDQNKQKTDTKTPSSSVLYGLNRCLLTFAIIYSITQCFR